MFYLRLHTKSSTIMKSEGHSVKVLLRGLRRMAQWRYPPKVSSDVWNIQLDSSKGEVTALDWNSVKRRDFLTSGVLPRLRYA